MLKNLTSKQNQSPFVVTQLLKYSTNKVFASSVNIAKKSSVNSSTDNNENLDNNEYKSTNHSNTSSQNENYIIISQFIDTLKVIIVEDKNFMSNYINSKKTDFIKSFNTIYSDITNNKNNSTIISGTSNPNKSKYEEVRKLIVEFQIEDEEEIPNSNQTSKSLKLSNESNKLKSSMSTGKIENYSSNISTKNTKLEVTTHGNLNSSLRKFQTISPINKFSISGFMTEMNKDTLKFIKDPKYPFARLASDVTLTLIQINKCFISELKALGFTVLGSETSESIKAEKKHFDFIQSFLNCFRSDSRNGNSGSAHTTSIFLTTRFSDTNKFERLIEIMGTSGKKEIIVMAIEAFFRKIRTYGKKLRPLRVQDVNSKLLFKSERSSSHEKTPSNK